MKKFWLLVKNVFDFFVSLIALLILSPLFLLVSILIKVDSRGPVFFIQERVGKNGKLFKAYKFRTMTVDAPEKTKGKYIEKDNPYVTRVGRILRRTGIDELPQLINVLKGEMSLVGPRPTLPYQVAKYSDCQKKRLIVKPGITGWALVNGRNKLTWEERINYDIWYIENWSFWLDIKILFKTVWVVAKGEGLYADRETDSIAKVD
ncbi:MAG: exopolysaccharide biosynthesis polyprenyl glycosylphosphotransferase [Candidatus Parvarchaeota archaeon]|nr:exopolysaccharide biosynthesis polyprenyl glycosylphosphotransferase [Candidatus Rehaiarchaeum fermentans]